MKDLNIVFLNYFCKDDILAAVDSVLRDIRDCPYNVVITVADNSENADGIRESLESKYPEVRYVDAGGNVGFGAGNVVGFKDTEARYYFALNRDTIVPENSRTMQRIIRFLDEHPKIGAIGPRLQNMDGSLQYSCYRFDRTALFIKPFKQMQLDKKYAWVARRVAHLNMHDFDHKSTRPVDWVLGAAMVVRKEVIDEIGWFDPRFFMYLEDADWCKRMWEAGWPVYYVHDIVIKHRHERASAQVPGVFRALLKNKLARIHAVSWLKFLWKWRGNHKYYAQKIS